MSRHYHLFLKNLQTGIPGTNDYDKIMIIKYLLQRILFSAGQVQGGKFALTKNITQHTSAPGVIPDLMQ